MMRKPANSLYLPETEHDACGIGFLTNLHGRKSHHTVANALTMLENMEHRGACGCEPETGDGAGILLQVPHEFLKEECAKEGLALPEAGTYGVGMVFFPNREAVRDRCRKVLQEAAEKLGLRILGYRELPVSREGIGQTALSTEPKIEQLFIVPKDAALDAGTK